MINRTLNFISYRNNRCLSFWPLRCLFFDLQMFYYLLGIFKLFLKSYLEYLVCIF